MPLLASVSSEAGLYRKDEKELLCGGKRGFFLPLNLVFFLKKI